MEGMIGGEDEAAPLPREVEDGDDRRLDDRGILGGHHLRGVDVPEEGPLLAVAPLHRGDVHASAGLQVVQAVDLELGEVGKYGLDVAAGMEDDLAARSAPGRALLLEGGKEESRGARAR